MQGIKALDLLEEIVFQLTEMRWSYLNAAWERITGFPLEMTLGQPLMEYVHPHDQALLSDVLAPTDPAGVQTEQELQIRLRTRSGTLIWVTLTLCKPNRSTEEPQVQVSWEGVLRPAQTLNKLFQDPNFRSFVGQIEQVAIMGYDQRRRLTFWNQTCEILYGYSAQEVLGKSVEEVIVPEPMRGDIAKELQDWIGLDQPFPPGELYLQHKNGELIPVFSNHIKIRDDQGEAEMFCLDIDLRETLRIQSDLEKTSQQLSSILDNAGAVLARFRLFPDHDWSYEFFSAGTKDLFGFTPEEMIADKHLWISSILPEDVETVVLPSLAALMRGEQTCIEFRFQRKDGQIRWISDTLTPRYDPELNCWQITCVEVDITARKQMEEVLQQQAQKEKALNQVIASVRESLDLQEIFSTATGVIAEVIKAQRVSISQYLPERKIWRVCAEHLRSVELPSALGLEISDQDNPIAEQLRHFQVVRIQNTETLSDPINQELSREFSGSWLILPLKVGQSLWGALNLLRHDQVRGWQDSEVALATMISDQLAIAINQAHLYQQLQFLNTDLEDQVRERTVQLERTLGFQSLTAQITERLRDELDETHVLQTAIEALTHALDLVKCDSALYDLQQGISTIQYEYKGKNLTQKRGYVIQMDHWQPIYTYLINHRRQLKFSLLKPVIHRDALTALTVLACPLYDDHQVFGDMWLFRPQGSDFYPQEIELIRQIASQCSIALRQARLYQAAQRQVEELQQLNHLKDDFLSTVSHELRSPVTNMRLSIQMTEILIRKIRANTPEASDPIHDQRLSQYLQILRHECDREIDLINDLLDLQRLEAGNHPLELEKVDLQYWLPSILEPIQIKAEERQIELSAEIDPNIMALITDPKCLKRILSELLHNACKYTAPHEWIRFTVAEVQGCSQPSIEIEVVNSGVEMPQAQLERLFEKFYRVPQADRWQQGGTGLGLALVRQMVTHLGGEIGVTCQDRLLTFTLTLPRDRLESSPSDPLPAVESGPHQ